jgi:TonB family protein
VKLCVNPRGTVEKVDVLRSSGYPSLDNSALNALAKWKFASSADSFDSNAVDCFRLPVQFTLEA